MKRTRKWAFVAQEATRLADLGLTPPEIAKRLDLRPSTVQRWMKDGKLADTRRGGRGQGGVGTGKSAEEWGKAVRSAYALDADDLELVKMGELALTIIHNAGESTATRLSAMGRFQAIVKQLALVARNADESSKPEEQAPRPEEPIRPREDPRRLLKLA